MTNECHTRQRLLTTAAAAACLGFLVLYLVECDRHAATRAALESTTASAIRLQADLDATRAELDQTDIITRVMDGDTLELRETGRVRLLGIDTPETWERIDGEWRKIKNPDPRGVAAARWLRGLIGRRVRVQARARDVYGRTLARLTLLPDNLDLAYEIEANGWTLANR